MSSLQKANFTFRYTVIGTISYIQIRRTDLYIISEKAATLNLDIKHSLFSHKYDLLFDYHTHTSYMQTILWRPSSGHYTRTGLQ